MWKAVLAVVAISALCTVLIELYERKLKRFFRWSLGAKLAAFAVIWVVSIVLAIICYPRLTAYPNYMNDYLYDWLPLF